MAHLLVIFMKRLLSCLLFAIPFLSAAQSNFQYGYVVTDKKDTLKGYVNYRERSVNPSSVQFKPAPERKTQVFDLKSSAAYAISGVEKFQRFVVDISMGKVNIPNLSIGIDSGSRRDTVFLKVLQEGKYVSLYSYKDEVKNRFYIRAKNSPVPEELIYQRFLDPEKSSSIITTGKYAGQLLDIMLRYNAGTNADVEKLRHLNYDEGDILKITSMINGQQAFKSKTSRVRLFAGTGVSISSANYRGDNDLANAAAKSKSSVFPVLTAGADLFANPAIGKLIYRVELSLAGSRNEISTTTDQPGTAAISHRFDQYTASVVPQVIYNIYNTGPLKIFLAAGFALNVSKFNHNRTSVYNSVRNETTTTENLIVLEGFTSTFPVKAGIVFHKRIEVSAIYVPSSSVTNYNFYGISVKRFTIGLNYLFGK
ncbi:hypothetical protein [Pedobacter hartonius]|uniref:hypothetical protein n=1 Tax=Pedobacter hartonius TaxID=425514 RepID=UPI001115108D|nr:hypothetical protein [Pedobacter hartonius]